MTKFTSKGVDAIENKIGALTDFVRVPYTPNIESIIAYLHTGYNHVHGASFVYPKYAAPVELTSNADAWNTTGAKIEEI